MMKWIMYKNHNSTIMSIRHGGVHIICDEIDKSNKDFIHVYNEHNLVATMDKERHTIVEE